MEHRELCPGVHAARVLLNNQVKNTMIRVINTSDKAVKVPDQELLGVLQTVDIVESSKSKDVSPITDSDKIIEALLTKVDPDVPSETKDMLVEMLREFPDVFAKHKNDLDRCDVTQYRIATGEARPVRQPLRINPKLYR